MNKMFFHNKFRVVQKSSSGFSGGGGIFQVSELTRHASLPTGSLCMSSGNLFNGIVKQACDFQKVLQEQNERRQRTPSKLCNRELTTPELCEEALCVQFSLERFFFKPTTTPHHKRTRPRSITLRSEIKRQRETRCSPFAHQIIINISLPRPGRGRRPIAKSRYHSSRDGSLIDFTVN